MARARIGPMVLGPESVVRRRPADMGLIYGKSPDEVHPLTPPILSRPGWQGAYEGASIDRAPGATNDDLVIRDREYIYRRPYTIPAGATPASIRWLDSGPTKDLPTFRFNRNIRPIVGGSNADRWGMHTNIPTGQRLGTQLEGRRKMKAGKQNRLTVQRYRGQSYSATTEIQN